MAHTGSSQTPSLGYNRTGIATSPHAAQRMLEGTSEFGIGAPDGEEAIGVVREQFARDAEPLGSVPPPAEFSGLAKMAVQGIKGNHPTQYMDKLGERLAFERCGVRLYEALISKFRVFGGFAGGPSRIELEQQMLEEHEHFQLLSQVIAGLGGDPTVMTPSADLHATMSRGILDVMVDARTTFVQCLEAILLAELADNNCWETLVDMAEQGGDEETLRAFVRAQEEEAEHLENVRRWLAAAHKLKN